MNENDQNALLYIEFPDKNFRSADIGTLPMKKVCVYYNKNWNTERGTKILNALLKHRKPNPVGYHSWPMKTYPAAEWEGREKKNLQVYISLP